MINAWNVLARSDANRQVPLAQLLEQWRREDATDDPDEIRRSEEELAEFKRQMNENRAGEEPLFV